MLTAVLVASVLAVSAQTDYSPDSEDDLEFDSELNSTARGEYLGDACDMTCSGELMNVVCEPETKRCECVKGYPVRLGPSIGCAKPVNIGDQCFYQETCEYTDLNSDCVQVKHNALCQCKKGYHAVTLARPKRIFCSEDVVVIATDMTTLLGVASGMAVLTGLICFTLKLFVGARPRRYASGNIGHPILFAQPTGMTGVSVLRGGCTRASRGGLVPSSRAGAARAAAILLISCHLSPSHGNHNHNRRASVHSSTSSTKSFSARQFERERENRLLARARNRERDGNTPSPSPRSTENLLEDPLPSETWPKTDQEKGAESEAFTPDALKNSVGGQPVQLIDDPLSIVQDDSEDPPTGNESPPPYREHPSPTSNGK